MPVGETRANPVSQLRDRLIVHPGHVGRVLWWIGSDPIRGLPNHFRVLSCVCRLKGFQDLKLLGVELEPMLVLRIGFVRHRSKPIVVSVLCLSMPFSRVLNSHLCETSSSLAPCVSIFGTHYPNSLR